MNAIKSNFYLLLLLLIPAFLPATSSDVTFNYSGFVRVNGVPLNGPGEFKLAITTTNGNITLWSNDSTSSNGSEPTSSITSPVSNGIFSINVGDPAEGMDPINRALFNNDTKNMRLRIWFNDGVNGFQALLPARKLDNIELLAFTTGSSNLEIYVDANSGDDLNDGLTTTTAKATLQAAINIVPGFIESPVTIKMFPGNYREMTIIKNLRIGSANGSFRIEGDNLGTANPIRMTGSDDDIVAVRKWMITIDSSDTIEIDNILFDMSNEGGVLAVNSNVRFTDCEFSNMFNGSVTATQNSSASLTDCHVHDVEKNGLACGNASLITLRNTLIEDADLAGIFVSDGGRLNASDSTIQNIGKSGISLARNASADLYRVTVDNCGIVPTGGGNIDVTFGSSAYLFSCTMSNGNTAGLRVLANSTVFFRDEGDGDNFITNNVTGIIAELNSSLINNNNVSLTMSGNTTNLSVDSSSALRFIP